MRVKKKTNQSCFEQMSNKQFITLHIHISPRRMRQHTFCPVYEISRNSKIYTQLQNMLKMVDHGQNHGHNLFYLLTNLHVTLHYGFNCATRRCKSQNLGIRRSRNKVQVVCNYPKTPIAKQSLSNNLAQYWPDLSQFLFFNFYICNKNAGCQVLTLKRRQHYTKYFDRLCFTTSDFSKLQMTYLILRFLDLRHRTILQFIVEAIFQCNLLVLATSCFGVLFLTPIPKTLRQGFNLVAAVLAKSLVQQYIVSQDMVQRLMQKFAR